MEAILVTVSVLSTLVVVAIVLSVVVILHKLKGKVGVEVINETIRDFEKRETELAMEISGIMNETLQLNETLNRRIDREVDIITRDSDDRHRDICNNLDDVDSKVDSRADKLYTHIGSEIQEIYNKCECLNKNDNKKVLND